jgi:addiction module RelE/StbE family toxin
MYNIELLLTAKKDIESIVKYISDKLHNKSAAKRLHNRIINSINGIRIFPYGNPIYPIESSNYEYRNTKIDNYLIFYTIDEKKKIIIICRIIYQKADIGNIFSV